MTNDKSQLTYSISGFPRAIKATLEVLNYVMKNHNYYRPQYSEMVKAMYEGEFDQLTTEEKRFVSYCCVRGLKDFNHIQEEMDHPVHRVLEIGSGIGLTLMLLMQNADSATPPMKAVIAEQTKRVIGNTSFFMKDMIFRFFQANDMNTENIFFIDGVRRSQRELLESLGPFDLIYSFRSAGYHYSLNEYFPYLKSSFDNGAYFVGDFRPHYRQDMNLFKEDHHFDSKILFSSNDKDRVLFKF